ncbi:MAG: ATP-binding protein [Thermoleophilaceae bacterium]
MTRRDTLLQRVLAANLLLFLAVLFAATALSSLDVAEQRREYLVVAMSMILVLLVNFILLRRRFDPLERLIARVEALDPADPGRFVAPPGGPEEIERLAASFRRLLEGIEEERNRSGRLVLRAQEAERKRIARDLHDEANQALAAITMRLEALAQDAPAGLSEDLLETKRLAGQAMEELLALARQLRPAALDDHGLVPALQGQVRRFREQTGIRATFVTGGDVSTLSDDSQLVVYRVAQEALTNAGRHAAAAHVEVALTESGDSVELIVRDDGSGFDRSPAGGGGLGLEGMAERARLVGGELELSSGRGRGTRVTLRVPA